MKFLNTVILLIPFLAFQLNSISVNVKLSDPEIASISIEDIEAITKQDDKKVIIKLSAAWCKPSKKLALTLEDPEIQKYLDDNFHVVDFDIQTKTTINYQGKTYNYVEDPKMGYHELAYQMLDQRLSFPALLVLDSDLNKIDLTRGYKNKKQLLEYIQAL